MMDGKKALAAAQEAIGKVSEAKVANDVIAPVEGDTASQAYDIGDYLMHAGKFCKVISAIAQGDPIILSGAGTNVTERAVSSELGSGGGGGGTSDYDDLSNKPSINSTTLSGAMSAADLGLVAAENGKGLSSNDYTDTDQAKLASLENYDDTALSGRVTTIEGMIPSTASSSNKLATAADIPSTSGKADKVTSATENNIAKLDANGNLADSGFAAGDVLTKSNTAGLVKNDGTIDTNAYEKTGVAETLVKDTVGWSGKNLLPMTVEGIKALNTIGTWSGNTFTLGNLTFEILTDNEDNVTGIEVNGTTDSNVTVFAISQFTAKAGTYEFNGTPLGGGSHTYYQEINAPAPGPDATDEGSGANYTLTTDTAVTVSIIVDSGVTMSDVVFRPMLRHAGTDAAFEPYHATVDGLLGGKADKVQSATNGDFAGLDSNGNLTDSGKKASDFSGKNFDGTSQEWATLSAAQKAEYAAGLVLIKNDTANAMLVDSTPTENSNNLVKSGGVYTAVDGCVHKTGNETIAGTKTFSNSVLYNGSFMSQGTYATFAQGGLFDIMAAHTPNNADKGKLLAFDVSGDSGSSIMHDVYINVTGLNMNDMTSYKGGNVYIGKLTTGVGNVSTLNDLSNYTMLINTETKEVTFAGVVNANGSDYAERFETLEDCPVGRFVTLDGEKIRLAQPDDDYILGVTSENPAIVGDKDNDGVPVGLIGKLWVEHDGTARVNGYVVCGEDGIATITNYQKIKYRVMAVDGNRCKILVK